jgi:hypothetical protein
MQKDANLTALACLRRGAIAFAAPDKSSGPPTDRLATAYQPERCFLGTKHQVSTTHADFQRAFLRAFLTAKRGAVKVETRGQKGHSTLTARASHKIRAQGRCRFLPEANSTIVSSGPKLESARLTDSWPTEI